MTLAGKFPLSQKECPFTLSPTSIRTQAYTQMHHEKEPAQCKQGKLRTHTHTPQVTLSRLHFPNLYNNHPYLPGFL